MNKIDDELYKKIISFCEKVNIFPIPEQKEYTACMKIVDRMKAIALI
tara:strand:+ start:705 stop:845 length:141 start_codon:yes stop_codon:yes gene_type:complete